MFLPIQRNRFLIYLILGGLPGENFLSELTHLAKSVSFIQSKREIYALCNRVPIPSDLTKVVPHPLSPRRGDVSYA